MEHLLNRYKDDAELYELINLVSIFNTDKNNSILSLKELLIEATVIAENKEVK
ncbi:MAG: hypothetical protein ACRCU6_06815 [Fusobacteriaceae bacterium]